MITKTKYAELCPINYDDGWAIHYLTESDIYKWNMALVMFLKHPDLWGTYIFKNRTKGITWTKGILAEINRQIDHLCTLRYTEPELEYLKSIRFLGKAHPEYIEYLRLWRPIRDYVKTAIVDGELQIEVNGPMFQCMQFEIYLLEIVVQAYNAIANDIDEVEATGKERLVEKMKKFTTGEYTFKFAEFGARRRASARMQQLAVEACLETGHCVGTSNVYLAMIYGVKPIGTYAHEFVQMYQGINGMQLAYTNHFALKEWFEVFNGDNGTALTDTLSTDLFLLDFDKVQATMYTGVRHDSGDPYQWGEKIIAHYEKLGIDPKTKTLLFSDSLDFDKAQEIYDYFKDRINVSFGIGTFITNDTCATRLNIVVKLQYVNGKPVAKLSDNIGKTLCQDATYLAHLKEAVEYRITEGK